jgi:GNAT superfamily N-acetyltransferase
MSGPVGVRLATPADLEAVEKIWFGAMHESGAALNAMPFSIARHGLDSHIKRLLARSQTHVAFATVAPDEILGYCVTDIARDIRVSPKPIDVCHHVFVKSTYRRQGIARAFLGSIKTFTHPATPGAGKKFALALGLAYNPRLA